MIAQMDATIMKQKDFAKWLKQEREKRNLSQTQLGVLAGVSMRTIQNAEKGENIKLDIFFKIIESFNKEIFIGDKIKNTSYLKK